MTALLWCDKMYKNISKKLLHLTIEFFQDRFLKKEIDKTPKNGYILCINAMKKSVHRRQLSREPGQVKAGKCAEMRCRF